VDQFDQMIAALREARDGIRAMVADGTLGPATPTMPFLAAVLFQGVRIVMISGM